MKHRLTSAITLLTLCLAFVIPAHAADEKPATHHYEGKVTGLFCSACSAKVKAAMKKLEGVSEVKITKTEEHGVQKILLDSTSPTLNKEDAIKALGEDAKSFTILSLERTKPKAD